MSTTEETLRILSSAMQKWSQDFARRSVDLDIDKAFVERIKDRRTAFRSAEGGGGMCHWVTEWLQDEYGLERMTVTYLTRDGGVAYTGHLVSILKDGTILDGTADQIGEGHDVRTLTVDDPEYGRYRPEFMDEYNPLDPEAGAEDLSDWLPFFDGVMDVEKDDASRTEKGFGWWVEDKAALIAYLDEQIEHAGGSDQGFEDYRNALLAASVPGLR